MPLVLPLQLVSSVPSDLMCAMLSTCFVPMDVKKPPMKKPPAPSEATAKTLPPTVGQGETRLLDVLSTPTKLPVSGPT